MPCVPAQRACLCLACPCPPLRGESRAWPGALAGPEIWVQGRVGVWVRVVGYPGSTGWAWPGKSWRRMAGFLYGRWPRPKWGPRVRCSAGPPRQPRLTSPRPTLSRQLRTLTAPPSEGGRPRLRPPAGRAGPHVLAHPGDAWTSAGGSARVDEGRAVCRAGCQALLGLGKPCWVGVVKWVVYE
jgi:hypothetical protein